MTKKLILRAAIYIPMIVLILWLTSAVLDPKHRPGPWIWLAAFATGLILSYTITKTSTSTKHSLFSGILGIILAVILWATALLITFASGPN